MTHKPSGRLARMAPALAVALACVAGPLLAQGGAATPVGLWKTIDDDTKQAKALIRVTERDGQFSGRIEKILTDKADAKCELCTDERKDKPVQGMTIVTGMKRDGEHWSGGQILDPNNGKVYRSQMKLIDGGKRMEVRGYIGTPLLGRTQTWHREE